MTFTATTALPYEHLERAAAGLRAELRHQLLAADIHEVPLWETFTVEGPVATTDARGRTWFEYTATLQSRSADGRTPREPRGRPLRGL